MGVQKFRQCPREGQRAPARAALAAAFLAALLGSVAPDVARALTPSPDDWRDLVIYQVITDRFANGDPANDAVEGGYDPADGARTHGGDFAGLRSKLDYLEHLGVDAVWLSPVVLNANGEYHGYAARDFYAIAPHFGTLAELQALVADCHARGIYVIMDVIVNHMGDLIDSASPSYPDYRVPPASYTLRWRNAAKRHAGFFDDLSRFHAQGGIGSYTDPEQVLGELFGLDDLRTEDAAVQQELANAAAWLIDQTDCDGFRLDTVKHVDMGFWDAWSPLVHAHAVSVGKTSFFLFGEVFDGSDAKNGSYTGTVSGGSYKLDSVLHFPMYFTTTGVFGFDDPPANLSWRYAQLGAYDPTSRERLVTFLDNHDNARFLSFGVANQDEGRLRTALAWQLTSRGVPCVYYGTEQEFDGGGDPWNREDMWDGAWDFGPSDGDNFDLVHPALLWMRSLTEVRRRHPALRRGITTERFAEDAGPGLYAYERRVSGDAVLVGLNTSNLPVAQGGIATAWPAGTAVRDALEPAYADTVGPGGVLELRLPARGVRILETAAGVATTALRVVATFPGHDQPVNDRWSPLTLAFDRPVDAGALAAAFTIAPATPGQWFVAGTRARFFPSAPWTAGLAYAWSLDGAAPLGAGGATLAADHDATFRVTATAPGITVNAGYVADRIARQGLGAPEALLRAPWLGSEILLLSDTARDRVFTLTPGGDLGHWLGDARWSRAEGLARAADGTLAVVDGANGVFAVDPLRMTSAWAPPSGATTAGAAAWGGAAFGDALHLCDPAGNRVVRMDAGGALATFASGIAGPEGLAFGPGGAWGTDLFVADANLAAISPATNGPGRIVRLDPSGALTPVASDPALLGGASALAFDEFGRFGGDLFVADILAERILRVTPAGAVSVFATGFKNLSGSHAIAFGPDGALYVADAGSGQSYSNSAGSHPPAVYRIARADAAVGVPRADAAARLSFAPPSPNPSAGETWLAFALPAGGHVTVAIYDLAGRRVRTLADRAMAAGPARERWDGRDDRGRQVTAGVYLARITSGDASATRRLVRLP